MPGYLNLILLALSAGATDWEWPASAEVCGRCHRAIHEAWKESAHARAMESRLFQDALELAEQAGGAPARRLCLGCHSPVGVRVGDLGLRLKVSWEGITCDYCHSVREVNLADGNPRVRVEFGPVKSGTLKEASPVAHGTEYSEVHRTALICAPCHEYRNSLGFAVLTTFSEWKVSPAAASGSACQACHMARVAGDVVDPKIQRASHTGVNLHSMPGSHSLEQLSRAIGARLLTSRDGGQLKVIVELTNRAAGHKVPTGSALRQLRLQVEVEGYDGRRYTEQRTYGRVTVDARGKTLGLEHEVFLRGVRDVSDTRLAAGEKRQEQFSFALPTGLQATVKASLTYYYSPMARDERQQKVTFLQLRQLVK
jgi:hypothetical protein